MIYWFCDTYGIKKARTYKVVARENNILRLPRRRNVLQKRYAHSSASIWDTSKRDIGYLEDFMHEGYAMPQKYIQYFLTIQELYRQQKYMFDNKTLPVENRIVSISQPWIGTRSFVARQTNRSNLEPNMM